MGIRCANRVTPLYPKKLALTSATGGGRSVGIVRSRTKAKELSSRSLCEGTIPRPEESYRVRASVCVCVCVCVIECYQVQQ